MAEQQTVDLKDFNPDCILPPEGDKDVGTTVVSILNEVVQDKQDLGLHAKWNRNYELCRNKHFNNNDSKKVPLASANLIYRHRMQTVNQLTDNNPTFNVAQLLENPEYEGVTDTIHSMTKYWWMETEQQTCLTDGVTDGETYSCVIRKIEFDSEKEYGIGEVVNTRVDPFHFGTWPVNVHDVQDAEVNLHFYPMPLREARTTWPDFADKIQADQELLKELGDERREMAGGQQQKGLKGIMTSFGSTVKTLLNSNSAGISGDSQEVLICEAWVKDRTKITEMVGQQAVDPETGMAVMEEVEVTRPKYPGHIRRVIVCNAGGLVLKDKPNPSINPVLPFEKQKETYLFDKFPFIREVSVRDTSDPWGMSDLEQLERLNIEYDKTLSRMLAVRDKAVRTKLVNPLTSGVDNSQFTNQVGIINPTNSFEAQAIKFLDQPRVLPDDLVGLAELIKGLFFLVSGSFELENAQVAGSDKLAYKAIAALIEQVARMMRGKIRNYYRLIRETGRMYVSLAQNWYTEKRQIPMEKDGETKQVGIRGEDLIVPCKLTVVSGSTLPVSKVQQREESISLFKMRAFGAPGSPTATEILLDALEFDGRKEIVKKMQKGVFGDLFKKLGECGVPKPIIQFMQKVSQLDPKIMQQLKMKGQLPNFQQILMQMQGKPDPKTIEAQAEAKVKEAEVNEKNAKASKTTVEAQKVQAEIEEIQAKKALTLEQIATERLEQQVKIAGVGFDEEKLKIERAQLVNDIKKRHDEAITKISENKPGYNERGLKSNNV